MSRRERMSGWLAQWRGVPARAARIDHQVEHLEALIDELRHRLTDAARGDAARGEQLERLAATVDTLFAEARGRHDDVAGWERADEARAAHLEARLLELTARVAGVQDGLRAVAHEQRVTLESALAPRRDALAAELVEAHRHRGERRPGLSVVTITWNHAGWLGEAAASAAATLDALGDRAGVHVIVDDASSDETGDVLDELVAAGGGRVVAIRSPANLNLARARNVALAACPTEHAVVLDADNRLLPAGVADVHAVADRYRPAIAWGHVIAADDAGRSWDAYAYAPAWETLLTGLCFDSMAVVDVAAVEALGGYSTDPQLGGVVDDLELLLRALRRGRLAVHVPVVLGRYRSAPQRHSALAADHDRAAARVTRMYRYDDPDPEDLPVAVVHPQVGVLWAWGGARRLLAPPEPDATDVAASGVPTGGSDPAATAAPGAAGSRVLLVGPGGVGNLGDDAITWCVHDELVTALPGAVIDVVTDRAPLPQRPRRPVVPVRWLGSLTELWHGLDADLLARAAAGLGVDAARLAPPAGGTVRAVPARFDHDVVVFAGGGHLAAPFAADVMVPRLAVAACAAELGVPVVWSGQGVGPLDGEDLDLLRRVLGRAAAVGCRDELSAGLLDGLAVEVVGDDALRVPAAGDDVVRVALGRRGAEQRPYGVVHLRDAPYVHGGVGSVVGAVADHATTTGSDVVVLAVNDNPPGEWATGRAAAAGGPGARWSVLDASGDPELAVGVLAGASWVVAHSFHVALWALAAGTPALLVGGVDYYRGKALGLGRSVGVGDAVLVEPPLDAGRVAAQLAAVADGLAPERPADGWLARVVTAAVQP